MSRRIIRVNGDVTPLDGPVSIRQIARFIGADTLDTVNLRDGTVMLIDDLGHGKELPDNPTATALYWGVCRPGTTHTIKGDVVITFDGDFA